MIKILIFEYLFALNCSLIHLLSRPVINKAQHLPKRSELFFTRKQKTVNSRIYQQRISIQKYTGKRRFGVYHPSCTLNYREIFIKS